jgi:hypothetical protein
LAAQLYIRDDGNAHLADGHILPAQEFPRLTKNIVRLFLKEFKRRIN